MPAVGPNMSSKEVEAKFDGWNHNEASPPVEGTWSLDKKWSCGKGYAVSLVSLNGIKPLYRKVRLIFIGTS